MSDAPSRPTITARRIDAAATTPLRSAVLRPGYPTSDCVFEGDDAALTVHAGAVLDEAIVSIASMYHEPRPADAPGGAPRAADHDAGTAWRLRGMATEPGLRGAGAGRAALDACLDHARANGGTLAWCNARTEAVGFYERLGWQVLGEEFDLPTVGPHFVMELRLD